MISPNYNSTRRITCSNFVKVLIPPSDGDLNGKKMWLNGMKLGNKVMGLS